MRTTLDIPDPVYRELKSQAALEGTSVKELVLRRVTRTSEEVETSGTRIRFPAIKAKHPGSLKLGTEGVYEYISFP